METQAGRLIRRIAVAGATIVLAISLGVVLYTVLTPQPVDTETGALPTLPATSPVVGQSPARSPRETTPAPTPRGTVTPAPTPSASPRMPRSTASPRPRPTEAQSPRPAVTFHVVQPGETLTAISLLYDVTVRALVRENGLADPNVLEVGQRLRIPASD